MKDLHDEILLEHGFLPLPPRMPVPDGCADIHPGHFWLWLMSTYYKGGKWQESPGGDLAYGIWRDTGFPKDAGTGGALEYLSGRGVNENVLSALIDAVRIYDRKNDRRDRYRSVSQAQRFGILTRDRYTCQTCGARAPNVRLEIDHKRPVAEGGSNEDSNLWTLCFDCNRGKSDKA